MSTQSPVRAEQAVHRACDEARTVVELCRAVHDVVATVVPTDRWCGFAVDPSTLFATNGYHDEGIDRTLVPRLLELEHGTDDCNQLPALVRSRVGVATLAGSTGGDLATSARWREVLVPSGLSHELRAVCRDGSRTWGALVLFRASDISDFGPADIDFVRRIAPTVATGFRRVATRQQLAHGEDAREAGLVVVAARPIEVMTMTNAAAAWLEQLDDGGHGQLPTPVMSAIHACRAGAGDVTTVRARTRSGRWVTITAEHVAGDDEAIGLVVQPSRPTEIARIVGAAHGLTARESEVVVLVAGGHTNQEIARALNLSPHTVGDHLKSVFAKLGVVTRGEMTSKLFHDEYLPRELGGLRVGADGWYLPE